MRKISRAVKSSRSENGNRVRVLSIAPAAFAALATFAGMSGCTSSLGLVRDQGRSEIGAQSDPQSETEQTDLESNGESADGESSQQSSVSETADSQAPAKTPEDAATGDRADPGDDKSEKSGDSPGGDRVAAARKASETPPKAADGSAARSSETGNAGAARRGMAPSGGPDPVPAAVDVRPAAEDDATPGDSAEPQAQRTGSADSRLTYPARTGEAERVDPGGSGAGAAEEPSDVGPAAGNQTIAEKPPAQIPAARDDTASLGRAAEGRPPYSESADDSSGGVLGDPGGRQDDQPAQVAARSADDGRGTGSTAAAAAGTAPGVSLSESTDMVPPPQYEDQPKSAPASPETSGTATDAADSSGSKPSGNGPRAPQPQLVAGTAGAAAASPDRSGGPADEPEAAAGPVDTATAVPEAAVVAAAPSTVGPKAPESANPQSQRRPERRAAPPPLSTEDVNRLVLQSIPDGFQAVHRKGDVVSVITDLDGNGYSDVFVPAVRVPGFEDAAIEEMSRFTRLFEEETSVETILVVYMQRAGDLQLHEVIPLGSKAVFGSLRIQPIVLGRDVPFAVSVSFQTRSGAVREWVIFTEGGYSRFTLREQVGSRIRIDDIDGDGVVDVVAREQSYEAGIGYETYLTWYRWNGSTFELHDTVNVVRNLRSFLGETFELIRRGAWGTFVLNALGEDAARAAMQREGVSFFDIFLGIFAPINAAESLKNRPLPEDAAIRRVVYPDIRENPFVSAENESGYVFPLTVRFETEAGTFHVHAARVRMSSNPFGRRQFDFIYVPKKAAAPSN